LILFGKGYST